MHSRPTPNPARRRDTASTTIAVLMCRAARNRRQVIISNKAGKTEVPRNHKTGLASPVFCFVKPESIDVVGKSWSKS
jgi:hypothetical protein